MVTFFSLKEKIGEIRYGIRQKMIQSNNFWENLTMFSWSSCITPGKIHTGCQLHYVKGSSRDTTVMLTHQPFCTKNYNHLFPSRFVLPSKNPIQKLDSRIICWLHSFVATSSVIFCDCLWTQQMNAMMYLAQRSKITQNVAFEFFNFSVF